MKDTQENYKIRSKSKENHITKTKKTQEYWGLTNNLRKEKNGITLIALVVTIVVLLILAGITMNMLFNNGGLFEIANQGKPAYEIGALKDRINNVIADWYIDKGIDSTTKIDELWDKMVADDIIDNPEEDVEGPEKEGDYDSYDISTNEGYIVEILVTPDGEIIIGDVIEGDGLPPKIEEVKTSPTSNSIAVEVTMKRFENGTISYYYKKETEKEEEYKKLKEEVTDLTADFTGLEQNVVYNIKIVAKNENGSTEKVVKEITGELKGSISQKGETEWNNGKATIHLETETQNVSIMYQINGIEGSYLPYNDEQGITGLEHGDKVYAVLSDGSNITDYTSIDIIDGKNPTVTVSKKTVTTNSIQVQVSSSDAEWGMPSVVTYNYYIKTTGGSYSTTATHTGTETSYTFTGLTQNISYDVKVTTSDKAGNVGEGEAKNITTETVGGATGDLQEGNIIASEPTWSGGQASITLSKGKGVASNLSIEYQVGGVEEGKWTTGTSVTGLSHNSIVYARLTDGVNKGSYASVTILDGVNPQQATISLSGTSTTTTGSVTATVTHKDNESGVKIASCKWVYNTTSSKIGTNASSYTNTFSSNGQTITLSASSVGTYYLHVLTVDKAGRTTETVSPGVTVTQLVTGITVSPTSITIEEGETTQLTATISPSNASNKTLTWSSNNTSVATVSSNGLVTAKAEGTATITVKTTDGSNKSATSSITVVNSNEAPTTPTVNFSSKTTNSITVTAKGTDPDGDNLTYTLYTSTSSSSGFTSKATKSASSGSTVTLTASNLSQYTYYYYYVTVTDGELTTTSATSTAVRTYCPGNTTYCPGGNDDREITCPTCGGGRSIYVCFNCGRVYSYKNDGYCDTCKRYWLGPEICTTCKGEGVIEGTPMPCVHGYYSAHYYCSHGYTSQHD